MENQSTRSSSQSPGTSLRSFFRISLLRTMSVLESPCLKRTERTLLHSIIFSAMNLLRTFKKSLPKKTTLLRTELKETRYSRSAFSSCITREVKKAKSALSLTSVRFLGPRSIDMFQNLLTIFTRRKKTGKEGIILLKPMSSAHTWIGMYHLSVAGSNFKWKTISCREFLRSILKNSQHV